MERRAQDLCAQLNVHVAPFYPPSSAPSPDDFMPSPHIPLPPAYPCLPRDCIMMGFPCNIMFVARDRSEVACGVSQHAGPSLAGEASCVGFGVRPIMGYSLFSCNAVRVEVFIFTGCACFYLASPIRTWKRALVEIYEAQTEVRFPWVSAWCRKGKLLLCSFLSLKTLLPYDAGAWRGAHA